MVKYRETLEEIRARITREKANIEAERAAIVAENRKKILSPEELKALAEGTRHQPGFGSPYGFEGRWVWLSPHGNGHSRCGSPVPPPEEIKPHQELLWEKCQFCNSRKPWGGCGKKYQTHYTKIHQ